MNNNITTEMQEDIEVGIDAITVDIPLRVTMTSINDAPYEFTTSIDSLGCILLTPTTKDVEFVAAHILTADHETDKTIGEQVASEKHMSIFVKGNMLAESENHNVVVNIDEIGQVVISPEDSINMFVTATIEDSLNLITEDMQVEIYIGHKLVNTGDGWDIYSPEGELLEEGVATLSEAKIIVCTQELNHLQEGLQTSEATSDELRNEETPTIPEVSAEVIDESISGMQDPTMTRELAISILKQITDDFTEISGAVKCNTEHEKSLCVDILTKYYNDVNILPDVDADIIVIEYKNRIQD